MKNKNNKFARVMATVLISLLIFQSTGVGMLSVFADNRFLSGERIYIGNLNAGDILEEGVVLYPSSDTREGVTTANITVDGESFVLNSENTSFITDRELLVYSSEASPFSRNVRNYVFETLEAEEDENTTEVRADSEKALSDALKKNKTIVLANNIELSDCFFVKDGKEHVIDLNGYTLSRAMTEKVATGHILQVNKGSKLTITDSSLDGSGMITGGLAPNGGGIYVDGVFVFERGTITGNTADNGAGIFIRGGTVIMSNKAVVENNSAKNGGGIYVCEGGTLSMNGGKVTNNKAEKSGAGIWSAGTVSLKNAEISQNTNAESGGGVYNSGTMTVDASMVSNNSSSSLGGGFMLTSGANIVFSGDTGIDNNYSANGGGICSQQSRLELNGVVVSDNSVSGKGGGVYFDADGTLVLGNVTINGNTGGIYMNKGKVELAGGKTVVNENRDVAGSINSNIVLGQYKKIVVSGRLTDESRIGITAPGTADTQDVTEGYANYNYVNTDVIFFSDLQEYRVKTDNSIPEVRLIRRLLPTSGGYTIRVTVRVTDDADWWDDAFLYFYVRDYNGIDSERYYTSSPNFWRSIETSSGYYDYSVYCGTSFPSAVTFHTKYGTGGSWRDFEADVKVYINGVNCGTTHCVHNVYGVEVKETKINIAGDKYPYPEVELEKRSIIEPGDESSKYVTINAVDQYGVAWNTFAGNAMTYYIESQSFPDTDTAADVDGHGFRWKIETAYESDHFSDFRLTFLTNSNVYPEVYIDFTVHFVYPLYMTVIVDGEIVMRASGKMDERLDIPAFTSKPGTYITGFKTTGSCYLEARDDGTYKFAFGKGDAVLEAVTRGVRYYVQYEKNGDPLKNDADVKSKMNNKALNYGKEDKLSKNLYERPGYTFAGWNTKADGSGDSYANMEKVKNLTTEAGKIVYLYAQWKPVETNTTASIFSEGTSAIYAGGAVFLLTIACSGLYIAKKKKE